MPIDSNTLLLVCNGILAAVATFNIVKDTYIRHEENRAKTLTGIEAADGMIMVTIKNTGKEIANIKYFKVEEYSVNGQCLENPVVEDVVISPNNKLMFYSKCRLEGDGIKLKGIVAYTSGIKNKEYKEKVDIQFKPTNASIYDYSTEYYLRKIYGTSEHWLKWHKECYRRISNKTFDIGIDDKRIGKSIVIPKEHIRLIDTNIFGIEVETIKYKNMDDEWEMAEPGRRTGNDRICVEAYGYDELFRDIQNRYSEFRIIIHGIEFKIKGLYTTYWMGMGERNCNIYGGHLSKIDLMVEEIGPYTFPYETIEKSCYRTRSGMQEIIKKHYK